MDPFGPVTAKQRKSLERGLRDLELMQAGAAARDWELDELAAAAPKRRKVRDDRLLITAKAAADLLGISVDTLRAMDLPRVWLPGGSRFRYHRQDILEIRGCPSDAGQQRQLDHRLPRRRPAD